MEGHSSRDRLVGLWSGGSGQKQARHVVTDARLGFLWSKSPAVGLSEHHWSRKSLSKDRVRISELLNPVKS